jgi:nucleotide-binding universal stress UspA family protein
MKHMKFLVAFSSPKRSAYTLEVAAKHAQAMSAELFLIRVIPDPKRVGIVAELIATDQPLEKAKTQIDEAVKALKAKGLKAKGEERVGRVARTIIGVAKEVEADMIFIGAASFSSSPAFMMPRDPIVRYLVDHSPVTLCLVRHPGAPHLMPTS